MELNPLQNWLWKAACSIRGEIDAARYKDYILPLLFYKRLDDLYSDELTNFAHGIGLDNEDGSLRRFHKIAANPMWNQEIPAVIYENDSYGRFACYQTQGGQGHNRSA